MVVYIHKYKFMRGIFFMSKILIDAMAEFDEDLVIQEINFVL